jgi:hypothetical protein
VTTLTDRSLLVTTVAGTADADLRWVASGNTVRERARDRGSLPVLSWWLPGSPPTGQGGRLEQLEEHRNQRSGMTAATHSAADITWIDSILFNDLRNHSSLGRDVVSTGRCQPERCRLA